MTRRTAPFPNGDPGVPNGYVRSRVRRDLLRGLRFQHHRRDAPVIVLCLKSVLIPVVGRYAFQTRERGHHCGTEH